MKNTRRTNRWWVGGIILVSMTCALGQDWPQWRGAHRDGKAAGFQAPETWPQEMTAQWKVQVGSGDATPALVGNQVYVFARQDANEVILCLDAASGKELWRNSYPAEAVTGPAGRHPGPRSSPAVAHGKVVTLGVGGVLSCLDAKTHEVLWRKDTIKGWPKFFTSMSPIIVEGMAIAHLGGSDSGTVKAFDLATGQDKWTWTGDGPAYSSPVLMTAGGVKQVVVQGEKNLVGLALADGKQLWLVATPTQQRFYNSATPIVEGETVIYTGQGQGTKAIKIEKNGDAFKVGDLWTCPDLGTGYNTPVLKDGLLYGLSNTGNLFCVDAKTGKAAWTDSAKRENFGAIVDAGACLLALPEKSGLIAFKPGTEKFEALAQIKVSDTAIYAHPVVAGKRIYIKDQDSLALYLVN